MKNIWQKLKKPFLCLAPMEGVTDSVFRRVVIKAGRPDLFFSEFTSVEGIQSRGFSFVKERLDFELEEKPIIAQIWGTNPENFYKTAKELLSYGFDGIDINMGCPEKNVVKKGGGAALLKNWPLAEEIIQATKEGLGGELPVSVKTRIGFDKVITEEWVEFLLKQGIDALTVHGRTAKQMSKVDADWGEIGKAVGVRNKLFNHSGIQSHPAGTPIPPMAGRARVLGRDLHALRDENNFPLIIGNGDVGSYEEAVEKANTYGVDGVMIGRGVFENINVFKNPKLETLNSKQIQNSKLELLIYHLDLWEAKYRNNNFHDLRKFFKIYAQGFRGAKELRIKLMECENGEEVREVMKDYLA